MIDIENSLLLIIDVQEKLVNMVNKTDLVKNVETLVKSAGILNIPTLITEQYPKGLGYTLEQIKNSNKNSFYFKKTSFSAIKTKEILDKINEFNKKQIIICGIEAHICVLQTAIDLKKLGYEVFFVNDCSASRKESDYIISIELLNQYDIKIASKEIVLFSWLKSSKHENFKEIQALIK